MTSEDRLAVSVRCGHALVELGVDASTADLVAASGLSERSFFRQFPTKADCIRPLLEHGHRRFVAEFTRRAEAGPVDLAETARSALVGVPLWEHAIAVVLVLACIYALVRFAGRVYACGLLHAGPRLSARAAWRLTHER